MGADTDGWCEVNCEGGRDCTWVTYGVASDCAVDCGGLFGTAVAIGGMKVGAVT